MFFPALLLSLAPPLVAAPPSLTDAGRVFGADDLRALPRPANVWSLLGEVPGVVVDRVDVGGSETALQSLLVARGDTGAGATWTIDGVDVTDPAALGSTLVFPDLETLDSVDVRTSTLDVRVRTPGVQVSLGLPTTGDQRIGRAWLSDAFDGLQADNLPASLRDRPFFRNQTRNVFEGAAQLGGPVGGRGWLWGAASHSRLRQDTFTEHPEELSVTSLTAKARASLGGAQLALLGLRNEKRHQDRDTGFSTTPEARWIQSGPSWLVALEAQRSFGRTAVLGRVSWLDAGFRLDPQGGTDVSAYEDFSGVLRNSYYTFSTRRPRFQTLLEAQTPWRAGGLDHHLLLGAGYRRSTVSTDLSWPGNQVLGLERQSVFFRTFELTGFALPMRDQAARSRQEELEAYAQDSLRRGRVTLDVGLRLDHLQGRNLSSSVDANPEFPELLPAVAYAGGPTEIRWTDLLPRAGVTWDVRGDGRSRLFAGYAAYAAALSAADVVFDNPIGREPASLTYYWRDLDADHVVDRGELDLVRGSVGASGLDPSNPGAAVSPHLIADDLQAPRTHELRAVAAQAAGSWLRLSLESAWRRSSWLRWTPLRNLTLADYVIRGAVQGELFGEPYSVGYFAPATESRIVSGNGRRLDNRPAYRQESVAVTLSAAGDWGRRAQARVWAAFTDWREYFEDRALAVQDPTSTDTEPLIDVGPLAVRGSGLGRADVFANARWTGGATLSAQVPARLRLAARLQLREGFPIPYFQVGNTGDPTAGAKNVLVAQRLDQYRLPALVLLDLRVARGFSAGPGTLSVALDGFNVLNRSTTLQRARDVELPAFDRPREILRPRILRFGVEYAF